MANPNPFTSLKEDHKKVAAMFAEIEDTTERAEKTRQEVFAELKTALDMHTTLEETALYPALEKVDLTHDLTLEAEEEHKVAKDLLEQLAAEDPTTEEWTAKITVLRESIEHHVEEEETELFPDAEKAMSEDDLTALAEALAATRAELEA
jgi:hemerythrin-like domain-containing protein